MDLKLRFTEVLGLVIKDSRGKVETMEGMDIHDVLIKGQSDGRHH